MAATSSFSSSVKKSIGQEIHALRAMCKDTKVTAKTLKNAESLLAKLDRQQRALPEIQILGEGGMFLRMSWEEETARHHVTLLRSNVLFETSKGGGDSREFRIDLRDKWLMTLFECFDDTGVVQPVSIIMREMARMRAFCANTPSISEQTKRNTESIMTDMYRDRRDMPTAFYVTDDSDTIHLEWRQGEYKHTLLISPLMMSFCTTKPDVDAAQFPIGDKMTETAAAFFKYLDSHRILEIERVVK